MPNQAFEMEKLKKETFYQVQCQQVIFIYEISENYAVKSCTSLLIFFNVQSSHIDVLTLFLLLKAKIHYCKENIQNLETLQF